MVKYILFMDYMRQMEIDTFYKYREHYVSKNNQKQENNRRHRALRIALKFILSTMLSNYFKACQKHRSYYKGYPQSFHPLTYFQEPEYKWQCPQEMSTVYLDYPFYHVKYKEPAILPHSSGRTSIIPELPHRNLAARFNKPPCKAYNR